MKYKCDNCDHQGMEDNLPDAKKLFSRLSVGGIFTDKECPKCGALCFPVDENSITTEALTHNGETDYTLNEENRSVWITVGGLSVYIVRGDENVRVDILEKNNEFDNPIDSAYANITNVSQNENGSAKPRPKEELREDFLSHIRGLAIYWSKVENQTPLQKCEGVAFSILTLIDGSSVQMPAMNIVMRPHPDDKQYCIDNNENWIKDGTVINDDVSLHDLFYKKDEDK